MPDVDPLRETPTFAARPSDHPIWIQSGNQAVHTLDTDFAAGLTEAEAQRRLALHGPNSLQNGRTIKPLALFLRQFLSVIVWVLFAAAALSMLLGEVLDAVAIGAIILLNGLLGFYQEYRAESAVAALRSLCTPNARVVRQGAEIVLSATAIVPGDVLLLEAGDLVPSDARLLEASALRTNESPLTGESEPVDKDAHPLSDPKTPLAERRNMIYMGTSVVAGRGRALVSATGMDTEVGHIAGLLETADEGNTPLQDRLDRVGRHLLFASLGIVFVVFLLGVLRGEAPGLMLLTAVSLAVAAIPEGLPAVVTIALALGVGRMARRHALIRRLPAVETLGCVQVICSDKTGTLTLGEMTVRALWVAGRTLEVTGEGYSPNGIFLEQGENLPVQQEAGVRALLFGAAACNEAQLAENTIDAHIIGDPTEGALLMAAVKAGIHRADIEAQFPRLYDLPFDSERKRMTIVREIPDGARAFVKGAPDVLLARCGYWLGMDGTAQVLTGEQRTAILTENAALASRALRVIAVATHDMTAAAAMEHDAEAVETGLTLIGLVAMYDPPRSEAIEAVRKCRQAGIRTVMITGDHPLTAAAVARELGLLTENGEVATGTDVQGWTDDELIARLERVAVYARVTAEDKLRIVRAWQAQGRVVAMTGDGVNDAPAVREAAIGVAMGRTGTEVTREAADMVITDDNFVSIVAAVEEGRGIYDNIRKCLLYLLAGNMGEILGMLGATLAGWPLPLLPLQLLWINLVTDGLPALALAMDPADEDVLDRPPRAPEENIMNTAFLRRLLITGTMTASVALAAFVYGYHVEHDLNAARTYAFTVLVCEELLRSLGTHNARKPLWRGGLAGNNLLLIVVGLSLIFQFSMPHLPVFRRLFDLTVPSAAVSLALLGVACIPVLVLETGKEWLHDTVTARLKSGQNS